MIHRLPEWKMTDSSERSRTSKDFKRMTLGEIQLEEGEGTLMLRAKKIPGDTVMDFRLLLLTRVDL